MEAKKSYCFKEVRVILWFSSIVFFLVALLSYEIKDIAWGQMTNSTVTANLEGVFGAYCADVMLHFLGLCAFVVPALSFLKLIQVFGYAQWQHPKLAGLGLFIMLVSLSGLLSLYGLFQLMYPAGDGGWFGQAISYGLLTVLNPLGTTLLLITLLLVAISLVLNDGISSALIKVYKRFADYYKKMPNLVAGVLKKNKNKKVFLSKSNDEFLIEKKSNVKELAEVKAVIEPAIELEKNLEALYILPSTNLLNKHKVLKKDSAHLNKLNLLSRSVEEKLKAYGVKAEVVAANPGPVITQLELKLASGVKASKITSLANDLARLLSVRSVRVVEIIPGKATVGLELPNERREMVNLKEILDSKIFQSAASPLTLALGKDISGNPVIANLDKMPHLLVAGTTGSGKSVGVNAMILSLLYKADPDELKLVLIDPKMLELSVYQDIPHLLTPVVTDVQEASGVLRWCVQEMERRYHLMALLGVRNIKGYNEKVVNLKAKNTPATHVFKDGEPAEELEKIPYIVVVADEFADMMMVVGKAVEQQIARIAQKARAAGIHLILATQRPSVDVITGLIKANVPSRIAFQVSSKIDSRTILDQQGADQLLGSGDMLYLPIGSNLPIRVHGAFVEDDEVHRVVNALKKNSSVSYNKQVVSSSNTSDVNLDKISDDNDDPLYQEAVEIVIKSNRASISSIQRRLRIGYNRAATLIEKMEENGIIGPMKSAGKRDVLVKSLDGVE